MLKRKVAGSIAVCALIMGLLLSACSNQTDSSGKDGNTEKKQKITVLLPKHEMDNVGFMEKETRQFEKETGIEVELINMSWDNVADKITVEMTAGGDSYDVIELDNSWVAKFATNEWITPLDELMNGEMKDGILPGLLDKFSYEGKLYGIPWNNDTRFFMYNKKKLEDAGIAAPPKTWEELKEQSKILIDQGLVKYGFIDSYMQAQSGMNQLTYMAYSFGADFLDQNNQVHLTDNEVLTQAYTFIREGLHEDKFIDPASITSNYETVADVFLKGDTAFFLQAWSGIYQTANDPEKSKIVDEIAVAPYSIGVDESSGAVLTLPEAMAIPKNSKNKEAAWKYIEYMSSKAFDKRKAQEIGALPIWTDLFHDPELLEIYPHWEDFGTQSLTAKGLQDVLWYDQFSNVVQVESIKILLDKVSIEEGFKEIERNVAQFTE
ncbi:ABC transporter substrate-binding protein [Paenibacillus sp. J2TS4]|uniref:ABC transporter substrate-binding protein n=1 Tax=Paenibacillus sp. J2TS4 TaxID=2807194 RepID=UPI001AFD6DAE|nr:sugar ABC transporter substrate-binding protein [Paenibacillus sp. J2TS4]GIP33599.1 ABC transporter substrate-binding protein [Paenibacillus sp. J2TS4]